MTNLAVPAPSTLAPGQLVTGALWNAQLRDALNFLLNPPLCVCRQVTAQSIPNQAWTAVNYDTNTADTYGGHSTTVNPSRYVAQVPGWYTISAFVSIAAADGSLIAIRLAVNGTSIPGTAANTSTKVGFGSAIGGVTSTKKLFLNVGDYIQVQGYQSSGGAANTNVSPNDLDSSLDVLWSHM